MKYVDCGIIKKVKRYSATATTNNNDNNKKRKKKCFKWLILRLLAIKNAFFDRTICVFFSLLQNECFECFVCKYDFGPDFLLVAWTLFAVYFILILCFASSTVIRFAMHSPRKKYKEYSKMQGSKNQRLVALYIVEVLHMIAENSATRTTPQ